MTVSSDGAEVYTSSPSLETGERAGPFTAEESMDIVLGNAFAVDVIVNGEQVGPLGEPGEVLTITLPEDARKLLSG